MFNFFEKFEIFIFLSKKFVSKKIQSSKKNLKIFKNEKILEL
jgi:hypothetical protein